MRNLLVFMSVVMLISAVAMAKPADPPIVDKCKTDLAKRLDLKAGEGIKVVEVTPITWPDASLGMPEIGKMYAQVITPGYRIVLNSGNVDYLYTASEKAFRFGNQKASWTCSALYLKPRSNDPNLNGDLYQCSLTGTNNVEVASEVSDYYPQANGLVLFTRRTSRSGFDLFYTKADGKSKPVLLRSAFAFGDVAASADGKQWAAIVRPGLGGGWIVAYGPMSKAKSGAATLSLPDDVNPEQIAWSGDNLMILAKKGDKTACYQITPDAVNPEWTEAAYYLFPKVPDLMLNKSESLLVDQVDGENGKPAVEIGTVWFTGDRHVNARIENFTMRGFQFPLAGPYVFVWGEKGGKPAAYTVDFVRGETIALPQSVGSNVKPFDFPPQNNPLARKK